MYPMLTYRLVCARPRIIAKIVGMILRPAPPGGAKSVVTHLDPIPAARRIHRLTRISHSREIAVIFLDGAAAITPHPVIGDLLDAHALVPFVSSSRASIASTVLRHPHVTGSSSGCT